MNQETQNNIFKLQIGKCESDEKTLRKLSKEELKREANRSYRVADFRDCTKWDLIGMILRARYGLRVLENCKGWDS